MLLCFVILPYTIFWGKITIFWGKITIFWGKPIFTI
jgi:hypothetical protein